MMKYILIPFAVLFSSLMFSQKQDTVYIIFDAQYNEMRKFDYTKGVQAESPKEKLGKSIVYRIRQMEKDTYGDTDFKFNHSNRSQENYQIFGGEPPVVLKKPKDFLEGKPVLNINFFRKTPYIQIAKTFEKKDSWEQDVMIFMIDVDEIKNDSILLREVNFRRPVKQ